MNAAPARPLADPDVRRVALVRLRVGLGDLLASVPALRALRAARPDLEVSYVTFPEVAPVLARQVRYIDDLVAFPGWPGIPERAVDRAGLAPFLATTRARGFDLAVQMYGRSPAANEVTERLGARRTSGFFTPGAYTADLATHLPYPERRREVDRHLDLVEFLGAPRGDDGLEFPLTEEDDGEAAVLLAAAGVGPPYAVVHPGATAESRRWPPERFAAVADVLAERAPVVLTGAPGEEPLTAAVAERMRASATDLCGRTSLGGLAAVVSSAALLVSNDSGPAHLAAALGTPSVTVFLAGDPDRWAAADRYRHRVVHADVTCRPCTLQRCPIDLRCATALAPRVVAEECLALLDGRRRS